MHVHVEVSYDVLHMHVKMDYLHAFNPNEEWSGYCFIYDACICNKEQLQSTFCYMFNSVSFWIFWTRSFLAIGVGVMVLRINIFTYLSCVIFPLLLLFYDQYRIKLHRGFGVELFVFRPITRMNSAFRILDGGSWHTLIYWWRKRRYS